MLNKLSMAGIIPVIKINDANDAVSLCKALLNGGLPVAEITFRTAAAEEAIRRVHMELPDVILGAGTVTTVEQLQRAIAAGVSYIVSPGINPEIVRCCQNAGVVIIPGCANPTDIEVALSLNVKTVKFFPAEAVGGLKLMKALSGPYGDVRFVPTGGINEKNLLDYLDFEKVVACGGSWMVDQRAIENKDWIKIEAAAQSAVARLLEMKIVNIALNEGGSKAAMKDADLLSRLFGCNIGDSGDSALAGMKSGRDKNQNRAAYGCITIGCRYIRRARWHLERRGFTFDENSAVEINGKLISIYLNQAIAGFAIQLLENKQ